MPRAAQISGWKTSTPNEGVWRSEWCQCVEEHKTLYSHILIHTRVNENITVAMNKATSKGNFL